MKKIGLVFLIVSLVFFLGGCGFLDNTPFQSLGDKISSLVDSMMSSSTENTAEQDLTMFIVALQKKNYRKAATFISSDMEQKYGLNVNLDSLPVKGKFKIIKSINGANDSKIIDFTCGNNDRQRTALSLEGKGWRILAINPVEDY